MDELTRAVNEEKTGIDVCVPFSILNWETRNAAMAIRSLLDSLEEAIDASVEVDKSGKVIVTYISEDGKKHLFRTEDLKNENNE